MTLLESRMKGFHLMDKTTQSDGMGGTSTVYVEGAAFDAAYVLIKNTEIEVAYSNGEKRVFALFFRPTVALDFNDRVRCDATGKVYRITATPLEAQTAPFSALNLLRTTMEEVLT